MKRDIVQEKFLKELETTPIIQRACEKCGIARNSYYRWIKEDPLFATRAKEHMRMGIDLVSDVAESNVLAGIKARDPGYTKYWLSNRHEDYRRPFINRALPYGELSRDELERQVKEVQEEVQRNHDKWFKPYIRNNSEEKK